ncbi:MAG: hypothetical protein ABIQ40_03900 [Bacteroidia bacterium]
MLHAQTIAFVSDTSEVKTNAFGDTTYWFKNEPHEGVILVYYDKIQKQLAYTKTYYDKNRYDFTSWYRNGQLKKQEYNVDSLPYYRKIWTEWFPDGKVRLIALETRDSSNTWNYFSNGQLAYVKRLKRNAPWKETALTGEERDFQGNATLFKIINYFADSTVATAVYPSGKVWSISVSLQDKSAPFGSKEHYRISFYENGQLQHTPLYPEKGRQAITYFYESGKIKEVGEWLNGNNGNFKEFYESGKLKAEGEYNVREKHFTSTTSVNYCPVKSGHWKYYFENGKLQREEFYDGLNRSFKDYNKSGKVISEGKDQIQAIGCG